jgi:hypothetical protein
MVPFEVDWALPVMLDYGYLHLFSYVLSNRSMSFRLKDLLSKALPGPKRHFPVYFRSRRLSVTGAERVAHAVALSAGANLNSRLDEPLGLIAARF